VFFGDMLDFKRRLVKRAGGLRKHLHALACLGWREWAEYLAAKLREHKAREAAPQDPVLALRAKVERATLMGVRRYSPSKFAGRLVLFLPSRSWAWSNLAFPWCGVAQRVDEYYGPEGCNNDNMLRPAHAPLFAELFRRGRDNAAASQHEQPEPQRILRAA
jgi:hypothetical protein